MWSVQAPFEKSFAPATELTVYNEECPDTFQHPGYYEKIYL
jgi:hypothetical protein